MPSGDREVRVVLYRGRNSEQRRHLALGDAPVGLIGRSERLFIEDQLERVERRLRGVGAFERVFGQRSRSGLPARSFAACAAIDSETPARWLSVAPPLAGTGIGPYAVLSEHAALVVSKNAPEGSRASSRERPTEHSKTKSPNAQEIEHDEQLPAPAARRTARLPVASRRTSRRRVAEPARRWPYRQQSARV